MQDNKPRSNSRTQNRWMVTITSKAIDTAAAEWWTCQSLHAWGAANGVESITITSWGLYCLL